MGNSSNGQVANKPEEPPKILLKLRTRDIILHYSFKMNLVISDIAIFPHQLQGLKLWDIDVILARYVILESQRFRGKSVLVFKAGVGIAGVALRKWTDAKGVSMCDFRDEVIRNISSNCNKNGAKSISIFKINYDEMLKSPIKYDTILFPDLLSQGFPPQMILDIIRKTLNQNGQAIIILQQNKEAAKSLISIIDKQQFKIANHILTADQYEASPLLNKLQGQQEFPSVFGSNFYAVSLIKINQQKQKVQEIKDKQADKMVKTFQKIEIKQKNVQKISVDSRQNKNTKHQNTPKQQKTQKTPIKTSINNNQQHQHQIIKPVSHQNQPQQQSSSQNSPHRQINRQQTYKKQTNDLEKLSQDIKVNQIQQEIPQNNVQEIQNNTEIMAQNNHILEQQVVQEQNIPNQIAQNTYDDNGNIQRQTVEISQKQVVEQVKQLHQQQISKQIIQTQPPKVTSQQQNINTEAQEATIKQEYKEQVKINSQLGSQLGAQISQGE